MIDTLTKKNYVSFSSDLPKCVEYWSQDDVQLFLRKNNLDVLLIVFANFDGQFLYQSYMMCERSRETMFQAMREEVNAVNSSSILTLGTYLRFLQALKIYIPIDVKNSNETHKSVVCSLM